MDADNDGRRTEADRALAGETVQLTDLADGSLYAEVQTDSDGAFSFDGVIPGAYQLSYALDEVTHPAQEGDGTFEAQEGAMVYGPFTLTSGEVLSEPALGVVRDTAVGGIAWFDNGGVFERVAGVAVTLTDADGAVIAQAETGEDGSWQIGQLMPGDYRVSVAFPTGYAPVQPGDPRLDGTGMVCVLTSFEGNGGASDVFTLVMGEDRTDLDAGSVAPGKLGDLVWLDVNGDGLQATDEYGIPNVTVHLYLDGEEVATTVTDAYGFYLFTELYPAAYTLTADVTGVKPTQVRTDLPAIASVMGEDGVSAPVQAPSGGRNYNADLGFAPLTPGVFPDGYGEGITQDWTKKAE